MKLAEEGSFSFLLWQWFGVSDCFFTIFTLVLSSFVAADSAMASSAYSKASALERMTSQENLVANRAHED